MYELGSCYRVGVATIASLMFCSCLAPRVDNRPGRATTYEDPGEQGAVVGIGIDAQDLVAMTDQMMVDMLANPHLSNPGRPPRVIVDSIYFKNESSSRMNLNLITDRLRIQLGRAAAGRMVFVGRELAPMIEHERDLKRQGIVDAGSKPGTTAPAGGDYRLAGRITSLDSVRAESGVTSRYHQIIFEMVDLETGVIVWGGSYEFKKSGRDDVIYR